MQPNFLFITADDLNYNSVGAFGCGVDNITPNLDKLAREGMCFDKAHVTIAVCQPSRQCLLTGLYPHHNGALGFDPISEHIPTLTQTLRDHGYYNGIIGKVEHLRPIEKFCWDFCDDVFNDKNNHGRSPYIYRRDSAEFFRQAKKKGRPFFLMANSHDPHRPFAGSEDELTRFYGYHTFASRYYKSEEAEVPGFLPDLPEVRKELAQYYSSVHRCDETVGAVLRSLEESGLADNTLVIFLSDNGMAFPFAKANCYLNSTKTPFIARWPGVTSANSRNKSDYIAGVDFTPTILEAAGLEGKMDCDGRSYLALLKGEGQPDRDMVYTQFNTTSAKNSYPMRCIQSKGFGYIFNAWADGTALYRNESQTGLSYKAMRAAAENDAAIAGRVRFFDYRCREEFYDFSRDPDGLNNLANSDSHGEMVQRFRKKLESRMRESADPVLSLFEEQILKAKVEKNQIKGGGFL
ncbi:MAG: sulfatase [Treponema sp.]|jgi:N-sulfoglucosamine sulfohydrolase|nr:sulfatase [Treponema sp.]